MKVIISGGGTGGHIYPAIAIANKIRKENPKADILFIGTQKGLESEIVPKAGFKIKTITVSYLKRKISYHNVKSAVMLLRGIVQARSIVKKFNPDIVIGTGGFVCGPVLFVSRYLGIKTIIHEQNVFPGLTNRILEKYVDKVAISFDDARKHFKSQDKLVLTGNPIREEFLNVQLSDATEKYKGVSSLPLVLVVGGSGGSDSVNKATIDLLKEYNNRKFQLLFVTGKNHYESVMEELKSNNNLSTVDKILPYLDDMPHALKAADIVVCSAGAITLSEVTALGKPAIIVPKAYTAENHQEFNAIALENKGAAVVIKENKLTSKNLYDSLTLILDNKTKYREMQESSKKSAVTNALETIYKEIQQLLNA
ncbi:undecaprenyldiphospho-muramoylpentapeptide beta-N-acetylglucosaminyltransferase [Serpentinicella sp. ANB-PHB4]|uniref:undecaprenyldiphospho-muramoylpentapeptide beta-N-acetylglucosaminyltransferase n=1 Tax=Serpentinicella sp. ANB-PHB4 TaxID=3074076 RepID=UPI00285AB696|nr:undecaprenyldiphospho-muramoylpentapeptide beta-N-acetylglucosaminyltransferase [Serpentinicella sp. ANB-PHB4]MDR5658032.1 undecaprenyldiphospho-muramoylpentapeptide beta-N-acetylglucosaminyltransferase [Serpentinicella sp. ANB-PHB4]